MTDYDNFIALINKSAPVTVALRYLEKNAEGTYEHQDVIDNIGAYDNYALRVACRDGRLDIVNILLGFKEDGVTRELPAVVDGIAIRNNEALRLACWNGHLDIVNRLIGFKEDGVTHEFPAAVDGIAIRNNKALRLACVNGHLDVVNRLLELNEYGVYEFQAVVAGIAANDNEALRIACRNGHHKISYKLACVQWPGGLDNIPAELMDEADIRESIMRGLKIQQDKIEVASCFIVDNGGAASVRVRDFSLSDVAPLIFSHVLGCGGMTKQVPRDDGEVDTTVFTRQVTNDFGGRRRGVEVIKQERAEQGSSGGGPEADSGSPKGPGKPPI